MTADCRLPWIAMMRVACFLGLLAGAHRAAAEVLPLAPYELRRRLAVARKAAEHERFTDAAIHLEGLLGSVGPDGSDGLDGFVPASASSPVQRPIQAEALALLLSFPPRGIACYRAVCGEKAQRLLDRAIEDRDRAALAAVADGYLGTKAGADAALLLGYDGLDRGKPWESLVWLARLARYRPSAREHEPELSLATAVAWLTAGHADRARDVVRQLKSFGPRVKFRIGDEELTCADDPARIIDLLSHAIGAESADPPMATGRDWLMFRGDSARNAATACDHTIWHDTVEPLWRVADSDRSTSSGSEAFLAARLPAAHPLIVGDLVLARTPKCLVAVDTASGRQVWEYPRGGDSDDTSPEEEKSSTPAASRAASGILERSYEDAAYGQISSDGRHVFLLDGLGSVRGASMPLIVMGGGGRRIVAPAKPNSYNRLLALVLRREGTLAWSVGNASGEDEPQLAGAFFLGPPLSHEGRLYILAEMEGEISLCTLDARTGRLLWSLPLALPGQSILGDPMRRLAGATPSLAEGVLVCPTSAGAVVAVDPLTRSILWGREYPVTADRGRARQWRMAGIQALRGRAGIGQSSPVDASATIASGRLLLAPVESDDLYCLELRSGQLLWQWPDDGLLFIACVHDDTVVVVGTRGMSAYSLTTGKPAWREMWVELPEGSRPSGRGFLAGRFYYLPTTSSEIVKFDVTDGRIAKRIAMKTPPGNLVGAGDLLLSQSADAVEAFAPPQTGADN
ncbi:MAG: PQQ-like beta-propeller repeat protein [Planctomycetes bacterium]|nr:PQQ-like beta-propeller repeat protein [Planctomycetota bacterium]